MVARSLLGLLALVWTASTQGADWSWTWKPAPGDKPPTVELCTFKYGKQWAYAVEIDDGPKWVRSFAAPFLAQYHYTDAPPGVRGGIPKPFVGSVSVIAGCRMVNGALREAECFATYVNPGVPIPRFITSYTGITNADVKNAPPVAEALRQFSSFVGDSSLIAHNGHRFDMKFIRAACERAKLQTRSVDYFDSLGFSWKLWGRTRGTGHGLDRVLDRLGLHSSSYRRHDARGDVQLLGLAVQKMWPRLSPDFQQSPITRYQGVMAAP